MEVLLMNVLLAERTSNEKNHETSAAISLCRNAGMPRKGFSGIGI
jgi:hypothetical protein